MGMNRNAVKISNRVENSKIKTSHKKQRSTSIDDLYKEVEQAFSEVQLNDGLVLSIEKEQTTLNATITIKKWDYPILVTIESIIFIYILLLSSGIPMTFHFSISREMSNIGETLGASIKNIKEKLDKVGTVEDLKDLIMNSFENLYKPFEAKNTLPVGVYSEYMTPQPTQKIKINKRRKN
jgi:hypothetical protein